MAFYAPTGKAGKDFEVPETDQYLAVLVDVVDLGLLPYTFEGKTEMKLTCRFVWTLAKKDGSGYAVDSDGKPFNVIRQMHAIITEKSTLFKTLLAMTGKAFTTADDIEAVIGHSNLLYIKKEVSKKGKTFGNVIDVSFLPPGAPKIPIPKDYIRVQNRPGKQEQVQNQGSGVPQAQFQTQPAASPAPASVAFGQTTAFGGQPKADVNFNQPVPANSSGF